MLLKHLENMPSFKHPWTMLWPEHQIMLFNRRLGTLQFKVLWTSYLTMGAHHLFLIMGIVSQHRSALSTWVYGEMLMTSCFAGVFGGNGITRLTTQVTANAALGFTDVVRAWECSCGPWMGYWSMHLNIENILRSVQNRTPHILRNDNIIRQR